MENHRIGYAVESADGVTPCVSTGIATADQHNANGSTVVELHFTAIEGSVGNAFKQIYNVALQAQHHGFGFRVAHTAVVFYHHRFAIYVDKSEENEAFIVDTFSFQAINRRFNNAVLHLLQPFRSGKRHWRHASHTASVESCIALADAFIVLCFGKYLIVRAIGEHKYRTLDTRKELFDDHFG